MNPAGGLLARLWLRLQPTHRLEALLSAALNNGTTLPPSAIAAELKRRDPEGFADWEDGV